MYIKKQTNTFLPAISVLPMMAIALYCHVNILTFYELFAINVIDDDFMKLPFRKYTVLPHSLWGDLCF